MTDENDYMNEKQRARVKSQRSIVQVGPVGDKAR
jgi:hypothetical protein